MATEDPLDAVKEIRPKAYVWFACVLVLSGAVAVKLSRIDRKLYDTKNKYINSAEHAENRLASTSIPMEHPDERTAGELGTVVEFIPK